MARDIHLVRARSGWRLAALLAGFAYATTAAQSTPGKVYVAVADGSGKPVWDLLATDFVVRVDEHDRPVLDVRSASEPLSLVLIVEGIDIDSSPQARAALRAIITSVRTDSPDARIGLMLSEGAAVPTFVSVSAGAADVDRQVARFVESGRSAPLLESIGVAAGALAREPTSRRAVLAIANHQTGGQAVTPQHVADRLRHANSALWGIEVAPISAAGTTFTETVLAIVTRLTGGRGERVNSTQALEAAARRQAELLLSQYVVTYVPLERRGRGELRVGVRRDGVKVFAPWWTPERP